MTKRVPVTYREWLLFGLRWLMLIALLGVLLVPDQGVSPLQPDFLVVTIATLISGLTLLLLLLSDYWSRLLILLTICLDAVLTVGMVLVGGPALLWAGLVPVIAAGAYFDWVVGLLTGAATTLGALGLYLALGESITAANAIPALAGFLLLPAAGPLTAILSQDPLRQQRLTQFTEEGKRVVSIARNYMQAVHEVAEVLAASKLDPARVLDAVLAFGIEQLKRVDVGGNLSGIILLVDTLKDETVLRVARSYQMPVADTRVAIPGLAGVVYESIASSTPTTSRSPSTDAELQLFEGFRDCKTALSVPLHTGPTTYGVMVIGSTRQDAFNPTQIELMQTVANQATASLQNAQLYHSLVDERNRIVNIEKLARAKLAGELHDGPTQGVATIAMRVSYIRQLAKRKPEEIGDELYQVEELARRTAKEIRHLLFTLRPVTLESQGLEPALRQLAEKMQETYNQQVEIVFLDNCSDLLDLETATTLFSIVVEAVGNARKHAQAETIWVRAGIQDDTLLVEVEDNGIGFDVEQAMAAARSRAGHLGLVNLQDRAALVEGTLDIQSSPGAGAKVTVSVPMERVRRKRADAPSDVTLDTAGMFG